MKNSTDGFNSRLDRAEERINILERMSEENTQSEAWRPEKDGEQRRESETGRWRKDGKEESETEKR